MIFHSITYLAFFAIVLAIYWQLPRVAQNVFIVGASYLFYGWEHPWFLIPLAASTLVDFSCALAIERYPARRRLFLVTSICASVGLLATFKYYAFAVENLNLLFTGVGLSPFRDALHLALPVGLSFYTFQSIGYIVDVYRGRVRASHDLIEYALYVSFFPQLVAGPIERAGHMLPQYRSRRTFDAASWRDALGLILWGFFKKLVIADQAALVANKVFSLATPAFPVLWAGVFAFTIQIYADFSGYTDIARGSARLLGIDLMRNFRNPYLACSPSDFWRRWHISLSTWLRDFVYIPLGGSRCGVARASFNLLATFTLSGLWHGASWNYVLWGVYWGLLILAERFLVSLGLDRGVPLSLKIGFTFVLTSAGWLLFRERNLAQLVHELRQSPLTASADEWQVGFYLAGLCLFYALPLVIEMISGSTESRRLHRLQPRPAARFAIDTALASLLFVGILIGRSLVAADFIYFQF
ncbi:MAG: MBOAT family protein [Verrucomicrobiota bacterium]|nr:MBOAT family protein [Verrucomicrobiota bacterium]